jgi:hypothetical protein
MQLVVPLASENLLIRVDRAWRICRHKFRSPYWRREKLPQRRQQFTSIAPAPYSMRLCAILAARHHKALTRVLFVLLPDEA